MIRPILSVLFLYLSLAAQAQYLENFTGQNGKGLVDAICPAGTTNISNCGSICTANASDNTSTCTTVPPSFTGVNWSIVKGPLVTYFTDLSSFGFEFTSPDDFGVVSDRMQVDDPDNEMCWLSPTLNIAAAGAVSIAIDVSQTGGLESADLIRGDYSLNGGAYVAFETQSGAFAATQLNTSGLTGNTLSIRVCAITNGAGEQIFFDNVSVPQAGVTTGCSAPTITKTIFNTGSCNPNSGSIEVTATGGSPGYNVAWGGTSSGNPAGTEIAASGGTYTITPLAAGNYTITVTDAASCSATTTASVGTAAALSLSTQVLDASCSGLSDGEIDLTVSNGVPPYSYSWDNLPGSPDPQDQTGLAAGTYTVTVTDHAGCTATASATVGTAATGAYSETFSIAGKGILDPSTCSGADGTTCTNNNFVGVNWSIYGLSPLTGIDLIGDYFKTTGGVLEAFDIDQDVCWEGPVLDINPPGSGVAFSVGLNWTSFDQEPAPDYIDVEYSLDGGAWMRAPNAAGGGTSGHTVVYANGTGLANNGSVTVNVSGLTGSTLRIRVCGLVNGDDESFRIDNVSVPLAQGLACPQEIHVKQNTTNIADGGSFNFGSVNLGSNSSLPFTIENQGSFTLTLTGTPPNYVVKGGTNPGDFTITQPVSGTILGGASTTFTVVFAPGGLGARSCTLTIGNNDSDEDPYNITLNGTGACPAITFTGTPTATCAGTTNGQIAVSGVTGGTAPYMYSKDNGANYQSGATFTGLAANTYQVVVKDANNCTSGATAVTVNSLAAPTCSISGSSSVCANSTGNVYSATAGMSAYSWGISGSGSIVGSTTGSSVTVTAGFTGTYTVSVTITAVDGCTATCSQPVTINALPTITGPSSVCSGGSVMLDAGAGYSAYAWSGGGGSGQTATYNNITSPTTYTVTVTSNGCTGTDSHTVTVNSLPNCSVSGADYVCSNSAGNVYSAPDGMSAYSWASTSNGTITSATNGSSVTVTAGNYLNCYTVSVTITDGNGCTSSCSKQSCIFLLTPPANITVNPSPACFGVTLDLSTSMQQASSTISWSGEGIVNPSGSFIPAGFFYNNVTTAIPTTTGPHTYTVTVTTDQGCSNTGTASVTINPLPAVGCPGNSSVCSNVPAYTLTGGSPGGGTYSGPGVSAGMFNPGTAGPGIHTIAYTVTDGGSGCTNSCTFTIEVTSCTIDFSGRIKFSNDTQLGVKDAKVTLTGPPNGLDTTDVNGDFLIATNATSGSFTLKPTKTINKLNGVTMGDVTAIQQHVANTVPITDMYKLVGADVNKSNSVTTLDASLLNQALLGSQSALNQITSWRFVPTSHTMNNPPWGFPEQRSYTNINSSQTNQDFYGIKLGDVVTTYANPSNFGAGQALVLRTKDLVLKTGEPLTVDFSADQMDDLAAFQLGLAFDPAQLRFEAVEPLSGLPLTANHFGTYKAASGELRAAWSQPVGMTVAEAAPVFRLHFTALQGGIKLSDALRSDDAVLPALAYTSKLAESGVELIFDAATGTNTPAATAGLDLQVRPNPFHEETTVSFTLPAASGAELRVTDVTGKLIFSQKKQYAAGQNEEILLLKGISGMLYVELLTERGSVVRKMLSVN